MMDAKTTSAMAADPSTPPEVLARLLGDEEWCIRVVVVNPNLRLSGPPETCSNQERRSVGRWIM